MHVPPRYAMLRASQSRQPCARGPPCHSGKAFSSQVLKKAAARQYIDHLTGFEPKLRFMHNQKAIPANHRSDVSGSFPVEYFHRGFATGPLYARGNKMRERG